MTARAQYERDGFYLVPSVIPQDLARCVSARMDAVIAGEYDTGIAPAGRNGKPGESLDKLQNIGNVHLSDRTIHQAISHPAIGRWAATITGAKMVQVFTTQLLVKPTSSADTVNVGWHQDQQYWNAALQGELFTAWLAISDVTAASGPMRFVRGSHHWGLLMAGDFYDGKMDVTKQRIQSKHGNGAWEEVAGVLPAGGVSFHHRLTVHGSAANHAPWPRKSLAIHLRTEKSSLRDGVNYEATGYLNDFNDEHACPVIYREQ